nr:hypothetical protein [Tanacetum cinerariifolium]
MLHICLRVTGQSFVEPPFEEEILAFIRFLRHSAVIRTLTDVNINKLYQPWRSFAAITNKCLTRKSSGYDSLRLSQAQILWGLYHKRNVDYAYLIWEDYVYQFGALLPIELTNEEIRNSNAYKEYYAVATGAAPPKPKATRASKAKSLSTLSEVAMTEAQQLKLVTKRSLQQTHISQASSSGADERTSSIPGVPDVPIDESKEELFWNSTEDEGNDEGKDGDDDDNGDDGEEGDGDGDDEDDDGEEGNDDDDDQEVVRDDEEEGGDDEQEYDEEEYYEETRDEESFDPIPKTPENSDDEGNGEDDLGLNVGREEGHDEEEEFAGAVSAIPRIVHQYIDQRMNEAVQVAVQLQSDKLYEEAQKENDEFIKTIYENMQKIIKEQVKEQVKVQVSKILPRIEQTVNEQLEAKVLTRLSHSLKTSYAVADDLSEMELKKILIEKMEGNKSIQRSDEQRNRYKALVEAYESDKIILDTYEETVTLKRHRDDDADKDEEPSTGSDRGSKRRREGKEPESASAPTETATRSAGRSTQGTRSRQTSTSESATAEESMQTIF